MLPRPLNAAARPLRNSRCSQMCSWMSAPASAAGCLCGASSPDMEPPLQALATLRETNQAAFYGLLSQDLTTYLPLIYTPTGRSLHDRICS